jgi:GNAT superfamily N-acetyltransferase
MATRSHPTVKVRPAIFPDDRETTSKLFLAYEQHLLDTASVKLDFQNFEHELAGLPGKYALENNGALWLAYISTPATRDAPATETPIGCMGLRAFTVHSGELKRLYLTPESRGLGVSKMLMDAAIARAQELGYKELLLDTLRGMTAARRLYEKYGFVEIEAYYASHPDAVFYRLDLRGWASGIS